MRIPYISLMAAGALALSGCAYGDLGYGLGYGGYYGDYGSPYYGYGYGSPYVGVSYGYNSPYYGGYGYGAPFGWYDNYYYPGSGYYVYDVNRRPYRMSSTQRTYWYSRSPALRTSSTTVRPNWSGFSRHHTTATERQQAREDRRRDRNDRRRRND